MQLMRVSMRKNVYHILSALALAGIVAAGCSSGGDSEGDTDTGTGPSTVNSFTVSTTADRREITLGNNPKGTIHFEAKGFYDTFVPQGTTPDPEYIYFYIWNGSNFYYKGKGEGFLYIPFEYAYTDYWCNYGKVKGRSNTPGEWPIEACYVPQNLPWDSTKWYSFDIEWDGSKIYLYVDGVLRNVGTYGSNSLNLIAGMGWPPDNRSGDAVRHIGIVGQEFRNWSFKKK